jgi:enoyl-[acyl-carrier protein] reductase III
MKVSTLGLDGKVAVVTGGTRGLGRAIAAKLAGSGCHTYLTYAHDEAAARACAAELAGAKGVAEPVRADVTDAAAMAALLERVRAAHGRLDVLVHNAAGKHPMPAVGADAEAVLADVSIAVAPLLRHAGALAALMAGGGRVVAVSSTGAGRVVPMYVGSGLAKAALESAVRYLAVELAPHGIAVNAVATTKLDKGPGTAGGPEAAVLAAIAARTPGGRGTTPADVADAVALLCTDEAAWVQGQVLTVDGGLSLRA